MTSEHRPQHLLRASDFCRPRNPPKCPVQIQLLSPHHGEYRNPPRSRLSGGDPSTSIYVSVDLLILLSMKNGDVAWLQAEKLRAVAVTVVARGDSSIVPNEQQPGPDDDMSLLRIPPTVAASMGFCYPYTNGVVKGWIQAYTRSIPGASSITVRPWGRPVLKRRMSRNSCSPSECPNLESDCRLLTRTGVISVCDSRTGELFIFQIANGTVDNCDRMPDVFYATRRTEWKLESFPAELSIPRLPQMSQIQNYLKSLETAVGDKQTTFSSPPHPSVPSLCDAMLLPGKVPPSQAVLHVVGTQDNHVGLCVQAAADQLGMRYVAVRGLAMFAHTSGQHVVSTGGLTDQLAGCQQALQAAYAFKPCVVHLCDFDHELTKEDEPMRHMEEQRFWTCMIDALSMFNCQQDAQRWSPLSSVPGVVVVLSTSRSLQTGPILHSMVFPSVEIESPDEEYARYLWDDPLSFDAMSQKLLVRSAREIVLLQRQWQTCRDSPEFGTLCEEMDARKRTFSTRIPSVHWKDVGGLAHVRSEIMDAIELPLRHAKLFPPSLGGRTGILLYGPPGNGKTLIAKAVATECGLPFLSVKGPELLGSYVGESETNVRNIFMAARRAAIQGRSVSLAASGQPAAAVLFFDELDSLAPRRGNLGDGGGVMERVVATLLTELDGRESDNGESCIVFAIGATNRPDLLDPSLLRPGRLDRLVYLGLPTKSDDRAQILAASIRKFQLNPPDADLVAKRVVDELPPNLTGADFASIASSALMNSLDRICNRAEIELTQCRDTDPEIELDMILDKWNDEQLVAVVTTDDLIYAAKSVKPSLSSNELARYEKLREHFNT